MLVHPSFSPSSTTASDNLALVRLVNTARRRYRALCLPTQDSSVTGEVELVGWRISSVVGSLSQSLVSLKTTIVPDCGAGEERLCTSEDTRCQGDTGAPLVKSDNTLVGAMTGGTGCSKYDYGVFTKISSRFLGNQYISYCSTIQSTQAGFRTQYPPRARKAAVQVNLHNNFPVCTKKKI